MRQSRTCSAAGCWLPAALSRGRRWPLGMAGQRGSAPVYGQLAGPPAVPWGLRELAGLCVGTLTDSHVHRHSMVAQRQGPEVQVMGALHPAHPEQHLLHCVELEAPRCPCQQCLVTEGPAPALAPVKVRACGGSSQVWGLPQAGDGGARVRQPLTMG